MATQNQEALVIYTQELRQLIREEVAKFREELSGFITQHHGDEKLDVKPLNIPQVADRYGVTKATVHNWMKKGLIIGFKQGKGRYFYLHELDQNLKGYRFYEMLQAKGEVPKDKSYYDYLTELKNELK
jgi:hypothetical protein